MRDHFKKIIPSSGVVVGQDLRHKQGNSTRLSGQDAGYRPPLLSKVIGLSIRLSRYTAAARLQMM